MKKVFDALPFRLLEKAAPWFVCLYAVTDILQSSAWMFPSREKVFWWSNFILILLGAAALLTLWLKKGECPSWPVLLVLAGAIGTAFFAERLLILGLAIFCCLAMFEDFDKTVFHFLVLALPLFFLIILFSYTGIFPHLVFTRGEIDRYCLGFGYTTFPQSFFLFLVLALGYVTRGKTSLWLLLACGLCAAIIYRLTDSRAGFYLTVLAVLAFAFFRLAARMNWHAPAFLEWRWVRIAVSTVPLLLAGGFFILSILWQPSSALLVRLNSIFSDRIRLTWQAFHNHAPTLFGEVINWGYAPDYWGVDCSFFFYFFNYGVVTFIGLLALYGFGLWHGMKSKNYALVVSLLICLADGIVEPYLLDFKYNIFPLYAGQLLLLAQQKESRYFPWKRKQSPSS